MIRRGLLLYSPIIILSISWIIILSLYFLNPFHLPWIRDYTLFVLFMGISMIYLGFFTAKLIGEQFTVYEQVKVSNDFPFSVEHIKWLVLIITIISLIGVLGRTYLVVNQLGGFEDFFTNPTYVRKFLIKVEEGDSLVNKSLFKLFSYMGSLNTITVIMGGAISTLKLKNIRIITLLPVVVAALHSLAGLQRVYFVKHYVLWIACAFLFTYYIPASVQKEAIKNLIKKILYFVVISVFFIVFVVVLRHLLVPGSKFETLINGFYIYTAGNIFLLDRYLISDPIYYYGLSFLRSFIKWFVAFDLMEKSSIIAPHYKFYRIIDSEGNTFTYLRMLYEDFSIFGVMIISYIWGWVAYYVVKIFLQKFSFFRLGLASMMIYSLLWSFYGFAWSHITAYILFQFQLYLVDYFYVKNYQILRTN